MEVKKLYVKVGLLHIPKMNAVQMVDYKILSRISMTVVVVVVVVVSTGDEL